MTELTDSSPSALTPSVLCGSGILSQLASLWLMASSGHFDPGQTYDGYKAVEVLDPSCIECLAKGKDCFYHFNKKSSKCHFCFVGKKPCCCPGQRDVARWINVRGSISAGGRPIYSSAEVPISRINTEGVVKRIRRIANSTPDLDTEGSDELDGEQVEVVNNPVGHQSSTSPSQPPSKKFQVPLETSNQLFLPSYFSS
ncbi:hypothetical protein O181_063879 [Austropuccinia psidii MF-1]|uniref:Uncharacterized protein n=1 Tax=Austropuccinia psidii MF-1 TaxID=1389203 RepID=A0A9Q3ENA6_9BASI|nr:hypothetical protein [Austropuccinia psidii MF-1]